MNDPLRHVKPAVRALAAYTLAARQAPREDQPEREPLRPARGAEAARAGAGAARGRGRAIRSSIPSELLEALADVRGLARRTAILAGNGSNELIEALLLVTVGRGHAGRDPRADLHALRAAHHDPGRRSGARVARRPTSSTTRTRSLEARRAARGAASPSSARPTTPRAASSPRDEVRAPVRGRRRPRGDRRGVPRVRRRARWCRCWPSTRTWSCCARSRRPWRWPACASATCSPRPALVREIDKARLPYNLNFFSQLAALAALEA